MKGEIGVRKVRTARSVTDTMRGSIILSRAERYGKAKAAEDAEQLMPTGATSLKSKTGAPLRETPVCMKRIDSETLCGEPISRCSHHRPAPYLLQRQSFPAWALRDRQEPT